MYAPADAKAVSVPAFLAKLWVLVEDQSNNDLICWDKSGASFHIFDQGRFAKELLPYYFKHGNVASFIRQLNMYGFHKVTHIEQGALKVEKDDMEFCHPYFMRGNEHLLSHIKRKLTKGEESKSSQGDISVVLSEVELMKQKQNSVNTKLQSLKKENTCLWREVAQLRQKHQHQQQIVSKLIQFLVSLVGTKRSMPANRKRNLPMIVTADPGSKVPKYTGQLSIRSPETSGRSDFIVESPQMDAGPNSTEGLTIHDVTDQLPPTYMYTGVGDAGYVTVEDTVQPDMEASVQLPSSQSSADMSAIYPTATSDKPICKPPTGGTTYNDLAVPTASTDTSASTFAPEEMTSHIDTLQTELEGLKDYLTNRQYNFDAAAFTELFNPEFPLTINSDLVSDGNLKDLGFNLDETDNNFGNNIVGNELIKYEDEPNLFESLLDLPLSPSAPSSTLDTPIIDSSPRFPDFASASDTVENDLYGDMEKVD